MGSRPASRPPCLRENRDECSGRDSRVRKRGLVASPTVVTREATRAPRAAVAVLKVPNFRRASRSDWTQLLRFCTVGACGYVVNLAVYAALVRGLGVHYIPAAIAAFAVAWSCNFGCNKWWTFQRHGLSALEQAGRYLLV